MKVSRPTYLFQRYFNRTATQEELAELMEWISRNENSEEVKKLMDKTWEEFQESGIVFTEKQSEKMLRFILQKDIRQIEIKDPVYPERRMHRFRNALAVTMLVLLIATGYFWFTSEKSNTPFISSTQKLASDVAPGGNKATLTLGNGTVISLDSVRNGSLAQQGNTKVIKLNNGMLAYRKRVAAGSGALSSSKGKQLAALRQAKGDEAAVFYNSIATPRGGQYKVVLPDGSKVWLNAASSIRFPTAFVGHERKVEITGEAYFEIAKNKDNPFYVKIPAQKQGHDITVEVLGTHFDIKAYQDEPTIKTTLLEGVVKVVQGNESKLLRPNQQANMEQGAGGIHVTTVNVEDVVAWKNGFFHFNGDDMGTIMRKIERWYNVTVMYKGAVPSGHYTGIISRQTNLSQVLKMLELSGVHFKLKGKNIIVIS